MSYYIHITSTAEKDMNRAADHIEYVLKNPMAAYDLLDEAETQINQLADFPKRFPIVDDPVLSSWRIRFVTVKNYLVFYTVDEKQQMVIIIRFLYKKSDWNAILQHEIARY